MYVNVLSSYNPTKEERSKDWKFLTQGLIQKTSYKQNFKLLYQVRKPQD